MRLIVGAPVANRAWALSHWFACLAAQTRRPDGFCFVHSGQVGDDTWTTIQREADRHHFDTVALHHDPSPIHPRQDNQRFGTLARLRNELLAIARDGLGADLFLSLDTDIMLENPRIIEQLAVHIDSGLCSVAQPVAFFHPHAPRRWRPGDEACWAYNFGFFPSKGSYDPRRVWNRPAPTEIPWGPVIRAQIPMGCWLGNRRAIACRYQHHESGEDIGFAQSLEAEGLQTIVDTSLYAFHAWDEQKLAEALTVPA